MWEYKGDPRRTQGIPGVPARDMTDAEFKAVAAAYDEQFPDQPDSLRKCGLYQHKGAKGKGAGAGDQAED